jgi:hypothetical protein
MAGVARKLLGLGGSSRTEDQPAQAQQQSASHGSPSQQPSQQTAAAAPGPLPPSDGEQPAASGSAAAPKVKLSPTASDALAPPAAANGDATSSVPLPAGRMPTLVPSFGSANSVGSDGAGAALSRQQGSFGRQRRKPSYSDLPQVPRQARSGAGDWPALSSRAAVCSICTGHAGGRGVQHAAFQ